MKMNLWLPLTATSLLIGGVLASGGCNSNSSPESVSTAAPVPIRSKTPTQPTDETTVAAAAPAKGNARAASTAIAKEEPKKPYDPVAENGTFFDGWKTPKLAVVISGCQDGYLEPCGCAGLDRQKGGFSRRHALFKQLQEQGWPLAAIDVGGLVRRFGKQAEVQFGISAEALKTMGYNAVGFSAEDLRLSAGEVVAAVAAAQPSDSIFVSANVNLFDLTSKVRIVKAGGMKLGITSVLGKELQQQVNNVEVQIEPAAPALKKVLPELRGCDVRILLAHAPLEEATELALQFPEFDYVVYVGPAEVPPAQPKTLEGSKTRLIEVGHKGMYVTIIGFYDDPKQPVRFQRVALDSRFKETSEMKQLMATYQEQLQQLGWEGLGLKSMPHPRAQAGDKLAGQFAGAASCKECHPTAWGIWSKTKHAQATETLAKLDPPRQYDPECVSCHSTGWNAEKFFPYAGGFDSLEKTPLMSGNSCDNCHGPSAAHVAAENGRNTAKRDAQREALKITVGFAKENVCMKCHDHDNSPEFTVPEDNFEKKYWPKVEHKGKR